MYITHSPHEVCLGMFSLLVLLVGWGYHAGNGVGGAITLRVKEVDEVFCLEIVVVVCLVVFSLYWFFLVVVGEIALVFKVFLWEGNFLNRFYFNIINLTF